MLNNCILTGNLGADPEIFYSSDGEPIATFNLAFQSSKKKTGWIKVTCFHRLQKSQRSIFTRVPALESLALSISKNGKPMREFKEVRFNYFVTVWSS